MNHYTMLSMQFGVSLMFISVGIAFLMPDIPGRRYIGVFFLRTWCRVSFTDTLNARKETT